MTTRTATSIGLIAILLWSMLALFTAATGRIPPFQLNAMTFLVGGLVGVVSWIVRPQGLKALRQKPVVWALGIGGLFGYHALYFAALRLAPPAESGLINYLWPLLIVLFSSLLPGEHLRRAHIVGALLGFAGVIVLIAGRGAFDARAEYMPGYLCAFVAAFVWAGYSVLSRRFGQVPTDAVAGFCLATALLSLVCHLAFETTVWPESTVQWLAVLGARARAGRSGLLCLGHRHEAGRHPLPRRRFLCDAGALDPAPGGRGLCRADPDAGARLRAHRGRRAGGDADG